MIIPNRFGSLTPYHGITINQLDKWWLWAMPPLPTSVSLELGAPPSGPDKMFEKARPWSGMESWKWGKMGQSAMKSCGFFKEKLIVIEVPSGSLWQCLVGNYYLQLYIFRSYVKAPEGTNSMRALGDNQNQPFPNPHAAATPCNQPLWSQLICAWKSGGLKDVALAEFVPQKS